ncbi:MAG: hypothetical protein KGZ63_11290 [Clostridiales bacterium]|nr:hypothetical protein [Clostridiales bacterium]
MNTESVPYHTGGHQLHSGLVIGLIDYDGMLPILALMKISTYYKSLAVCVSAPASTSASASFSLNYGHNELYTKLPKISAIVLRLMVRMERTSVLPSVTFAGTFSFTLGTADSRIRFQ